MKVVHVLKRIEMLDQDIRDLKKLEKSIARDKSFSTPIYMSIEKQINLLLGERIKLLELTIANPPETLVEAIEGKPEEEVPAPPARKKSRPKARAKARPKKEELPAKPARRIEDDDDDDMIPMLTQDMIDEKISGMKADEDRPPRDVKPDDYRNDDSIKILDIALEKGTLNRKEIDKEKKVRFFRENFPVD